MSRKRHPNQAIERAIRPRLLEEYVGQPAVKKQMGVFIQAARQRGGALADLARSLQRDVQAVGAGPGHPSPAARRPIPAHPEPLGDSSACSKN